MAKIVTPLSDSKIKNSKPKDKEYNLSDGAGLSLRIKPNGAKSWLLNYKRPKTQKRTNLQLGLYPEVTLAKAREKRQLYRGLLADGIDPQDHIKKESDKYLDNNSFKYWATEYQTTTVNNKQSTRNDFSARLRNYIYPKFGRCNINEISPKSILDALKEIEAKGQYETAKRCKCIMSQVFRYASQNEACTSDPCSVLKGALTKSKTKHMPTLTEASEIGQLMRDIEHYHGRFIVKQALRIAPHVMLRPNEIRFAKWEYINFKLKQWKIPAEMMKMKRMHIVPLSHQVMVLLKELHNVTGNGTYLFPHLSNPARTMSENSLNQALHKLGYKGRIVAHGFRGMASSILHEKGYDTLVIEKQLSHEDSNTIRASYNHAEYIQKRTEMLNFLSNYLEKLRERKNES